ncbi:hypothetical protein PVK06_025240 [Gossypium arboreum]|uniref:START domain-containing protein n=1 Tax=Gossypium arboreum TaxID=29729 RepID=A0ABR0PG35_GOSAR|nr:hypothetical protein PVK06_025240 [Gossypium arboreum]
MAEVTASVILEQMTAITIDKAIEAWSLVQGAEKEVKRLETNFKAHRLELEDAEEKEYVDKQVKIWLDKFRYVYYDMEDVLHEWETAVQQLQTDPSGSASVRNWKIQFRGRDAVPENASVNTFVCEVLFAMIFFRYFQNLLESLPSSLLKMSSGSNNKHHNNSLDWTLYSSTKMDRVTSDVVAPSPWTIFGCQNGLRLFKEAKERDSHRKWDDRSAIMAVGVVDETLEAIFQTLMSLGPSRSQWDFCFYKGCVVEHLDGHTDIVHKQLYSDWLPWAMKRRDLLLRRYWRREDDGTYVILYHSVFHKTCPPQKSYVRACLKSGGYVISPVNEGKQSVVKHMLAIDWKFWKSYLRTSAARPITIRMLERVASKSFICVLTLHLYHVLAALRELFRAKQQNTLIQDGKEMASVLYTYRSCVEALPQGVCWNSQFGIQKLSAETGATSIYCGFWF